jgi:hypothetical protein
VTRSGKRRRSGKRAAAGRCERADELATGVRLAVVIWELISALIRDHLIGGAGPWRLL